MSEQTASEELAVFVTEENRSRLMTIWLDSTYRPYLSVAAPAHRALLSRPRATAAVGGFSRHPAWDA